MNIKGGYENLIVYQQAVVICIKEGGYSENLFKKRLEERKQNWNKN